MIWRDFLLIARGWAQHRKTMRPPAPGSNAPPRKVLDELMRKFPDVH